MATPRTMVAVPLASTPMRRTALVVEDSLPFARLLQDAITALGPAWDTRTFGTGADALAAFEVSGQADLILVDLGLPDMSGVEVIRAARRRFADTPVMVVSVLSTSSHVLAAIQAGARGYLQKGDSILSLSQAIAGVLEGDYPISPSLAHYLFKLAASQAPQLSSEPGLLSPRELELLRLLGQGYTYEEASRQMHISFHTAQTFSKRIYLKLEVGSKGEALALARDRGWL